MSVTGHKLISSPAIYVIGKTSFDDAGMNQFISARGYDQDDRFPGSPIQAIAAGASATAPLQDMSEMMAEFGGRFCYDSMLKGRDSESYIENILEQRHGSVLEHVTYNLAIDGVSRSLSMELIRHRAGFAISQESQRFVDAANIRFVVPPMFLHLWDGNVDCSEARRFQNHCEASIEEYRMWQEYIVGELEDISDPTMKTTLRKRANETARAVLPNSAETRLLWTGNLRALRHFCELRGSKGADLEIRRLAVALTSVMLDRAPFTFTDFSIVEGDFGVPFTYCQNSKV